ncbi:MAG: calcium/sodium antiporter [Firmicutes bacterium]|nr:calcium/sodium antiporter [Bacillota bacterium]
MNILLHFIILIAGFVLLIKGADLFVEGASGIAARFGISELVIGLTIVAMGTSAPEAAVSIAGAFKGNADISIGNVLGSNIMNVLVILGITATIVTIAVGRSTIRYEMPFMIAVTVLFGALGLDGVISRIDGVILWAAFIVYMIYLFRMARNGEADAPEGVKEKPLKIMIPKTIFGVVMIVLGSDFAVDAASAIAETFGMSERFIGLTIVALGTSLPELATSVTAARKGNADIAIGNIVGSNLFNILFVIGTSSLIIPIRFAESFRTDCLVALGAAVLLFLCCFRTRQLSRWTGLLMLACYGVYFAVFLL